MYKQKPTNTEPTKIIIFNKPFQVLSQFTDQNARSTLRNYLPIKQVYPVGRLDYDSEGLLLLTNNGILQHRLSNPKFKIKKTYLVQVEGIPTTDALSQLTKGVMLKDGLTQPAQVEIIAEPSWLWARTPPIRERKLIPTTWLQLIISEGRNRQVRRMTATVGYPTLRLIRYQIGKLSLNNLTVGAYRELTKLEQQELYKTAKITFNIL